MNFFVSFALHKGEANKNNLTLIRKKVFFHYLNKMRNTNTTYRNIIGQGIGQVQVIIPSVIGSLLSKV